MRINLSMIGFFLFFICCNQNSEGERIYRTYCANCHMTDGTGLGALIPPLAGSDYISNRQSDIACIIKNGLKDSIEVKGVGYASEMPSQMHLNETDICNVINYINNEWGNKQPFRSLQEVKKDLENCE